VDSKWRQCCIRFWISKLSTAAYFRFSWCSRTWNDVLELSCTWYYFIHLYV